MGVGIIVGLKLLGLIAALGAVAYSYHWTYERGWAEGYGTYQQMAERAAAMEQVYKRQRAPEYEWSGDGRLLAVDGQPTLSEDVYGQREYEGVEL